MLDGKAKVARVPWGDGVDPVRDWRALIAPSGARSEVQCCVCFDELLLPDSEAGIQTPEVAPIARAVLVAGDSRGVVEACGALEADPAPAGMRAILMAPVVVHLEGFGHGGTAAKLLVNAACGSIHGSARTPLYQAALDAKFEALPRAKAAMRAAAAALAGRALDPASRRALDGALRDTQARRICAEWGLDAPALARALGAREGVPAAGLLAPWDAAVFGPDRALGGVEPARRPDLREVHKAVRWVTGESEGAGREPIPHSTGGCAAFAAILNRVLGGRGRYVLSGDPHLGTCTHVALRIGDRVVDGAGVHRPDAWLRRWCPADGIVEVLDPSPDGDLVRPLASRRHGIDEGAIERDLREALRGCPHPDAEPQTPARSPSGGA